MEPTAFQAVKAAIVTFTDLGRDALHVYVGLAALILSAGMLRKSLRSLLPWFIVAAIAVAAELLDLRDDMARNGIPRWGASLHDIVNTLFWPSVILLLARRGIVFAARAEQGR